MDIRNYAVVTAAYWSFTTSDGALRMLVLLHFHALGYSPLQLATLFLLYEVAGIITNLLGGWVANRFGLKLTLISGITLQVFALLALSMLDSSWSTATSVAFVLAVQGISGVAKDLSKMSSKSAIKLVIPDGEHSVLFKWVAMLTGSKNALKGVGFFLGGYLLSTVGFQAGLWIMAAVLTVVVIAARMLLPADMGRSKKKSKFSSIFSKARALNLLSAARVFLFGARDVWFVVGLPVFLYDVLDWSFTEVGTFLALWVIGYGFVQGFAPRVIKRSADGRSSEVAAAQLWLFILAALTFLIGACLYLDFNPAWTLIGGLGVFGFVFAINSSVHSYLILALSDSDKVTMDVGFYYMANAAGRLIGTLLSGLAYQFGGLLACLLLAGCLLFVAGLLTIALKTELSGVATSNPTP